jgi:hypothetical protein
MGLIAPDLDRRVGAAIGASKHLLGDRCRRILRKAGCVGRGLEAVDGTKLTPANPFE